jgi:hypothetical protein
MGQRTMDDMGVMASAHSINRSVLYFREDVIDVLRSVSARGVIISGRVTDDDLPAIACLSALDEREGFSMKMTGSGRTQVIVNSEDIPAGRYVMDGEPVFENDLDWFILREVT